MTIARKRAKVKKKSIGKKRPIPRKKTAKKRQPKRQSKRKLSDITKKRSQAAKRGWETRRRNQENRRLEQFAKQQLDSRTGKKRPKPSTKKKRSKKRKQQGVLKDHIEKMLAIPQAQRQIEERLKEKLPGIFLTGWVETDESLILQRLIVAEQRGIFDETARDSALEFDWNLRDVYELWHSPDVYF